MKVIVLGAAGKSGWAAVHSLFSLGGIEHIYLADHDAESLSRIAADFAHLPVSSRFVDAESERSLRERVSEADLVIGCLGPFHRYEGRIVRSVIAAGRDYLSLCDDSQAAEEAFSLDGEARRRGVSILCGCGLTPGLSNLLACQVSSRLPGAESVELSWFQELGGALGTATLEHLLHVYGVKVPLYQRGGVREVRGGSWEELVEFPPPVGWKAVGFLGHPETITLPRFLRGVMDVSVKGGIGGSRARGLALHSMAWMSEGWSREPWDTALRGMAAGILRRGGDGCMSALRMEMTAQSGGGIGKVIIAVMEDYYRISGLVLAAAVEQWKKATWPAGVHPPEGILDHGMALAWLREKGVRFLVGEEKKRELDINTGSIRS
jgi:hypothetical protein